MHDKKIIYIQHKWNASPDGIERTNSNALFIHFIIIRIIWRMPEYINVDWLIQ